MAHRRLLPRGFALSFLIVTAAACGGGAAQTPISTTGPLPTTAGPTEAPATPRVTEPPLTGLELLWESSGDTPPTGAEPGTYSPAVDPLTGDIWVSMSSSTIWIFEKGGKYKGSFGELGDGPGEFNFRRPACPDCPAAGALAFAPDGTLFVVDVGNHRIQKFDPEHKFVTEWGDFGAGDGQFADAIQVATNGREVFVADDARQDTQVFDLDGAYLRKLSLSGWLAVDSAGSLFLSHEGTVVKYAADGTEADRFDLPDYRGGHHIGIAFDTRGRLIFNLQDPVTAGAMGLGELDPATGEVRVWSTGGETLAIAGEIVYLANYVGKGWPKPMLRAYAITAP